MITKIMHFNDVICILTIFVLNLLSDLTLNNQIMKKNLLAAIVVFFLTFVVLLVTSDINNKSNPEVQTNYYVIED
jgi:hypothetical protein